MIQKLLIPLLLVTSSVATSLASAQMLPSQSESKAAIDQAAQAYQQAEEKVTTLSSVGLSTQPPSNKGSLRDTLRPVVVESFVARQRLQQAELAELRRRLFEIEQALSDREKKMDTIVDARVDDLLAGRTGQAVTRVHSRYSGVVAWIGQTNAGDKVKAGQYLAQIANVEDGDKKLFSKLEIRAPVDGVIAEKNVNVGDVVKPNDTLFQISSPIAGNAHAGALGTGDTLSQSDITKPRSRVDATDHAPHYADQFDLETRERLAQVDLQAAQEEYAAAEKVLSEAKASYDGGTMTGAEFAPYQKALRQAKAELDRAKVKADGLARQRSDEQARPRTLASASPSRDQSDVGDQFDFETRERLAQADLEEAQAVCDAAQYDYKAHVEANKKAPGSTPVAQLKSLEAKVRIAEAQLQRANVKLAGFKQRRTELVAAADAAVAEAQAEHQKAAAKVATCQADYEATEAVVSERKADVEGASAAYDYRQKVYHRIKTLVEERGVEQKLADESEQNLAAAEAALAAAKAAVVTAKANATRSKSAVEEARAEVAVAEARLKAAQARRERLLHNAQSNGDRSAKAPGGDQPESDAPAVPSKSP